MGVKDGVSTIAIPLEDSAQDHALDMTHDLRIPFRCKKAVEIVKASLVLSSQKAWQRESQNTSIQAFRRIYTNKFLCMA